MIDLIYNMPQSLLRIVIYAAMIVFLLLAAFVVKRCCSLNADDGNAVNGAVATVSMMYAIFIGFVIFSTINNFTIAQDSSKAEAGLVASINYQANFLSKSMNKQVRRQMHNYLEAVINEEWPAMQEGILNTSAQTPLNQFKELLLNNQPANTDAVKVNIWTDIVQKSDKLSQEHANRIDFSQNLSLDQGIWRCLIAATVIMLLSNLFLYFKGRRSKIALIFCIGAITTLLLYLETSMDYPYRGHYSVSPKVFAVVLNEMNQ